VDARGAVDQQFGIPGNRVYYLAVPPTVVTTCVEHLKAVGMVADPAFTLVARRNPAARVLADLRTAAGVHDAFGTTTYPGAVLYSSGDWIRANRDTTARLAGVMTRTLAKELAPQVRVNAIMPGVTIAIRNPATGIETITANFANAHAAGTNIASAQVQTIGQYYGKVVTQVGLDAQTSITGTQTQTALTKNIDKVRQSIDGINIDEETQNLVKFQNAYQAAARTFNILDSMLNTVITTLGAH